VFAYIGSPPPRTEQLVLCDMEVKRNACHHPLGRDLQLPFIPILYVYGARKFPRAEIKPNSKHKRAAQTRESLSKSPDALAQHVGHISPDDSKGGISLI